MKVWSIIATILFLIASAASGWLYYENSNVKKELGSIESQKKEESEKNTLTLSLIDTLGYFAEKYLVEKQNPDEMTELAGKITEIGDRNLEVAYGALKESSEEEERAALQNFLIEFTRVVIDALGGKEDNSQSTSQKEQTSEKSSQEIEGEGEYSGNVFPKKSD